MSRDNLYGRNLQIFKKYSLGESKENISAEFNITKIQIGCIIKRMISKAKTSKRLNTNDDLHKFISGSIYELVISSYLIDKLIAYNVLYIDDLENVLMDMKEFNYLNEKNIITLRSEIKRFKRKRLLYE